MNTLTVRVQDKENGDEKFFSSVAAAVAELEKDPYLYKHEFKIEFFTESGERITIKVFDNFGVVFALTDEHIVSR